MVIAIVAILVSQAAPSFQRTITSSRVSSAVNTFLSDTRYARSESVRRGSNVVMCRSASPEATTPSCASGTAATGWITGWIIFEDRDSDGTFSAGNQLLRVQAAITDVDSIAEASSTTTSLRFVSVGRLKNASAVLSLTFGSSIATDLQRVVCVSPTGRTRIAGDGSSSCGSDV